MEPARPRWPGTVVPAGMLAIGVAAALAGSFGWALVLGPISALALFYTSQPPGVRVTAKSQPELWSMIVRVAENAGVAPPRRVWLTHEAEVLIVARRRRHDLLIGLPLLICLDGHEVRALIAHDYALLAFPRPDLVVPLTREWRDVAPAPSDPDPFPEDVAKERALRAFGLEVERAADAAATAAAGSRAAAARAIAAIDELDGVLFDLRDALGAPPRPAWRPVRWAIEDIDEAWQERARGGIPSWAWEWTPHEWAALQHPDLGDALLGLSEAEAVLRPPRTPIRLEPFVRRHRRRLARRSLGIGPLTPVRWYTLATAPADWWRDRARRSAERVRAGVTQLLGRAPVDHAEMAQVYLDRHDELMAILHPELAGTTDDDAADEPVDDAQEFPPILVDLLEDALFNQGWRLEHPLRRGVLIGPHGGRVDASTFTAETFVDGLRALLSGQAREQDRTGDARPAS